MRVIRMQRAFLLGCVLVLVFGGTAAALDLLKGVMPGAVSSVHEKYEGDCLKCHTVGQKHFVQKCLECHKEVKEDVAKKQGFHGAIDANACETCHAEHNGREKQLVVFDQSKFDHRQARFALAGKHQTTPCAQCHRKPKYRETPRDCFSCHQQSDAHKGALGRDCARCHNPAAWKEISFDHSTTTFPLEAKHRQVACEKCHTAQPFASAPTACAGCHRKDDKHHGVFGQQCERCHTAKGWKEAQFDHGKTRFALTGRHQSVACIKCHTTSRLKETPKVCVTCHKKDDYHQGRLGTDCARCHTAESWKKTLFDHNRTAFALVGRHRQVECQKCHTTPQLKETPKLCVTCHKKEEPHKGRLGTECAGCHTAASWKQIGFDHSKTKYPLIGKHIPVRCAQCHANERYKISSRCASCHRKDDPHKGKLGDTCERCHVERAWKEVGKFDHQKAGFPLLGKHATVRCAQCHVTPLFTDASSRCADCHVKDDYHKGNFGKKCDSCHMADSWKKVIFDHAKQAKFQLLGKHLKVTCAKCHIAPLFVNKTPSRCADCHGKDDYHKGKFGKKCEVCHTEVDWKHSTFDHEKDAGYALIGKHAGIKCAQCHLRPLFTGGVSRLCVTCHRRDDPHDGELGARCELCHSEIGFKIIKRVSWWLGDRMAVRSAPSPRPMN
jgi:predicted CXXCH cytochrome family protein